MMEISQSIYVEADFCAISFISGCLLILVYDCFRIFREVVRHGTIGMALEDLSYWLGCTVYIFYLLYSRNNGIIRIYFMISVVLGMLFYNHFVSPWVVKWLTFLIKKILFLLGVPLKLVGKQMGKIKRFLLTRSKKVLRFLKKQLKKMIKTFKINICKL